MFNEILFFKKNFAFAMLLLPVGPPTSWPLYVLIRWLLTSCHSSQKPHWLLVQSTSSSQEGKAGPLYLICMRLLCQVQWAPFASSIMRAGKLTQPRSLTRKSTQTGPCGQQCWVCPLVGHRMPGQAEPPPTAAQASERKSDFLTCIYKGKNRVGVNDF